MARDQTLPPLPSLEELLEEANAETLKPPVTPPTPPTPTTEAEAEELIRSTQWKALARLAGIIGNPKAPDSMVVSAAKEISGQLQRFTAAAANAKENKFPDKIEIILVSPDGKMIVPTKQGDE